MSPEIPSDLIRQIQTTLRKNAGIPPSFHPTLSPPPLPSLHDVTASLDPPSLPPHLCCPKCGRGAGLLRGPHSTLCVFCGAQNHPTTTTPDHSLSFASTIACKNLLRSLQLDGSEVIDLDTEGNSGSSKKEGSPGNEVVLFSLLDLVLTWQPEIEREDVVEKCTDWDVPAPAGSVGFQPKNLSTADFGNFFADLNRSSSINSEDVIAKKQVESRDVVSGSQSVHLFRDFQSPDVGASLGNAADGGGGGGDFDNSFADWEGGFQSASTGGVAAVEPRSVDLFEDSGTEFPSGEQSASGSTQRSSIEQEISNEGNGEEAQGGGGGLTSGGDWMQDDLWSNAADRLGGASERDDGETKVDDEVCRSSNARELSMVESKIDVGNDENNEFHDSWQNFARSIETPGILSSSSMNADGEITIEPISSMKESSGCEGKHDDESNALDPWDFLASSSGAPGISSSSWVQSGNEITTGATGGMKESSNTERKFDDDNNNTNNNLKVGLDSWKDSATSNEAARVSSSSWINSENEIRPKADSSLVESSTTENKHDALVDALDSWSAFASTSEAVGGSSSSCMLSENELTSNATNSPKESSNSESKHDDHNNALGDALDSWQFLARSNEAPTVSSSSWVQSSNEMTTEATTNIKESSNTTSKHDGNNDDLEDAFDSNQDFASSSKAPGVSSNSWIQSDNDIMPKPSSSLHDDNNNTMEDGSDSWQDFASSKELRVSSSSWMQSGSVIIRNENVATSKSVNSPEMDFGNFFDSDDFMGGMSKEIVPNEVNDIQFDGPTFNSKVHESDNIESINSNSQDPCDFTSLNGAPGDLPNSVKQTTADPTVTDHASETKPLDLQDMDFGSFLQSDFFSGALGGQKGLSEASIAQFDAPVSTSSMKELDDSKHDDDDDDYADSLDAWNDFTSSKEAPGDLPNSLMTDTGVKSSDNALEIKSVDQSNFEFGSFGHSDLFSRMDGPNVSSEVNDIHSDSLAPKSSTNEFSDGDNMSGNDVFFHSWDKAPTQTVTEGTSLGHTSGMKSRDLQEIDFGDFLNSDLFSGYVGQEGPNKVNGDQLDASVSPASIVKLNDTNNIADEDDSFDDWQDFICSDESGMINLSTQTNSKPTPYESTKTSSVEDSFEDWKDFTSSNNSSGGVGNLSTEISTKAIPSESTKKTDGEEDSFDDWQEFTGSSEVPGGLGNLSIQTNSKETSYRQPSGTKPLDLEGEFGSLLSDPFLGALGGRKGSTVKDMQNASISSRMNGQHERTGSGSSIWGATNVHETGHLLQALKLHNHLISRSCSTTTSLFPVKLEVLMSIAELDYMHPI